MPVYDYKGLDSKGKAVKGKIDGDNAKIARAKLRRQGIFPTEVVEKKTIPEAAKGGIFKFKKKINIQDLALFTRQLATLIKANVPIVDSLAAIAEQFENERMKLIVTDVKEQVNEGASLATSLSKYPEVFSNLFANMVKAGETAGTLDTVLLRLADYTESSVKLKNKIKGSMAYPVVLMAVGILIVGGILIFLIPKITQMFEDTEQSLPWITQVVIGASDMLKNQWYLILGAIFLSVYIFKKIVATEAGKKKFDRFVMRLPLLGKLTRMVSIARFSGTLSTLIHGGVPLLAAMDIVKNVIDNTVIRDVLIKARENISEGQSLAAPLKESGEFPPIVTHMISIGEKTGELEAMLNTIAANYDNEVDTTVSAMTQVLEPLLIVTMGAAVGLIVVAILLPILDLNKIATQ
jgi:general secretion pathway protein F